MNLQEIGRLAQEASYELAIIDSKQKNNALEAIAVALEKNESDIVSANKEDIQAGIAAGLTPALLDRLLLDEVRLAGIIQDLRNVARLADPVGEEFDNPLQWRRRHGFFRRPRLIVIATHSTIE